MEPTDSSACPASALVQMPGRVPDGNNTKTPSDDMVNWASESLADKPPGPKLGLCAIVRKQTSDRRLPALRIERDMGGCSTVRYWLCRPNSFPRLAKIINAAMPAEMPMKVPGSKP